MKLTKILLPTDFSAHSYEGLRTAAALAHQSGAELLIVHVIDPAGKLGTWPTTDEARNHLGQLLLATQPACSDVTVTHTILEGGTAEEIVRFARQQHADLIVMGSHGRAGIPRVLLGSVAARVCDDAPCPVLTIRPKVRLLGETKAWAHRKPQALEPRSPGSHTPSST